MGRQLSACPYAYRPYREPKSIGRNLWSRHSLFPPSSGICELFNESAIYRKIPQASSRARLPIYGHG